jgi:hypothetical protein
MCAAVAVVVAIVFSGNAIGKENIREAYIDVTAQNLVVPTHCFFL